MRKIVVLLVVFGLLLWPSGSFSTTNAARVKTWTAEKLYSADLNTEFDNLVNYVNNNLAFVTNITATATQISQLANNRFNQASSFVSAVTDSANETMNPGFVYTNNGRAAIDSLKADTLYSNTVAALWILTPLTNSTGRIGSDAKRFQSVNTDTVIHTVKFDSNDVKSGGIGNANLQVNIIDSSHVRPGALAGSDLAPTLSGNKTYTGTGSFLTSAASNPTILTVQNSSTTSGAFLDMKMGANGTNGTVGYYFTEGSGDGSAGNMRYQMYYDPASNYWTLSSNDTNGSGAGANVIRVPDGQLTVDGNSTFDDNAFDYTCPTCWRHQLEPGRCPKDGTILVWNDDTEMLREAIHKFGKNSTNITTLERVGVLTKYPDGQRFISMNKAPWVAFSAIVQQSDRITRENTELQAQIDELKRRGVFPVSWAIAVAVLIGVLATRYGRQSIFVILLCCICAGGAYALTMQGKILTTFYAGNYEVKNTKALRDSLVVLFPADKAVMAEEIQDSLRVMEFNREIRQGNNKILLTPRGKAMADSVMGH